MMQRKSNGLFISDTTILILVVLWLIFTGNVTSKNRYMRARRKPVLTLHEADKQIFGTQRKAG